MTNLNIKIEDDKFLWKLRVHREEMGRNIGRKLNWEQYLKVLFGLI